MKLDPAGLDRFLQSAKARTLGAALVHGEDRALVRDVASRLARHVVPEAGDPFRLAVIEAEDLRGDQARLADEVDAIAFLGGRRLVWLRGASDKALPAIEAALARSEAPGVGEPGFLLIEAEDLAFRSALRSLFESHGRALALACRGEDIAAFLQQRLAAEGWSLAPDALEAFMERIGGEHGLAERGLDTLLLYMAASETPAEIQRTDVMAAVPAHGHAGFEDVVDAALSGEARLIDAAVTSALAAGASPVGLLRATARAFQRLDLVRRLVDQGHTLEQAIGQLRPPLPFPARRAYGQVLGRWPAPRVTAALERLLAAERDCKTTGLPEDTVAAAALLALARPAVTRA